MHKNDTPPNNKQMKIHSKIRMTVVKQKKISEGNDFSLEETLGLHPIFNTASKTWHHLSASISYTFPLTLSMLTSYSLSVSTTACSLSLHYDVLLPGKFHSISKPFPSAWLTP